MSPRYLIFKHVISSVVSWAQLVSPSVALLTELVLHEYLNFSIMTWYDPAHLRHSFVRQFSVIPIDNLATRKTSVKKVLKGGDRWAKNKSFLCFLYKLTLLLKETRLTIIYTQRRKRNRITHSLGGEGNMIGRSFQQEGNENTRRYEGKGLKPSSFCVVNILRTFSKIFPP